MVSPGALEMYTLIQTCLLVLQYKSKIYLEIQSCCVHGEEEEKEQM